jgi:hypothetical protein
MSEILEKYDPVKLERIRRILEDQKSDGEQVFFEVFIDSLRIVRKTNDLSRFDRFKDYIDEHSRELKIIIYSSEAARNNKSHTFAIKDEKATIEKPLGEVDIDSKINQRVNLERERWDAEETKKTLAATEAKLAEAEEYIEDLQETIAKLKEEKSSLGGINGVVTIVKEIAPHVMPLIQKEHAGTLGAAEVKTQEATFKKKEENVTETVSDSDKKQLEILKQWQKDFTAEEFSKLHIIIKNLAKEKQGIDLIINTFYQTNNPTNQ